jgi:Protein of unknown function (DUF1759)
LDLDAKEMKNLFPFHQTKAMQYAVVIHELEDRFGGTLRLISYHMSEIKKLPQIRQGEPDDFRGLINTVDAYLRLMDAQGGLGVGEQPMLNELILQKLVAEDHEDLETWLITAAKIKRTTVHRIRNWNNIREWATEKAFKLRQVQQASGRKARARTYTQPAITSSTQPAIAYNRPGFSPKYNYPFQKATKEFGTVVEEEEREEQENGAAANVVEGPQEESGSEVESDFYDCNHACTDACSQVYTVDDGKCAACDNDHPCHRCQTFREMTVPQRRRLIFTKKACFNCLVKGHNAQHCTSKYKCNQCGEPHHTLLHRDKKPAQQKTSGNQTNRRSGTYSSNARSNPSPQASGGGRSPQ